MHQCPRIYRFFYEDVSGQAVIINGTRAPRQGSLLLCFLPDLSQVMISIFSANFIYLRH